MPRDPRARRVAEAVRRDPADPRTLAERAAAAGASRRTLIRLFRQETGMGFEDWQRQARLLAGLACLGEGGSVTEAAGASGYATPSAFAAMFRRCLGVAPSRFFATPDRDTEG
jgi:AraC-like DNA-binding protein